MNFWYECCIVTRQWDPELTVSYGCYTLQQLTSVKIRTMHSNYCNVATWMSSDYNIPVWALRVKAVLMSNFFPDSLGELWVRPPNDLHTLFLTLTLLWPFFALIFHCLTLLLKPRNLIDDATLLILPCLFFIGDTSNTTPCTCFTRLTHIMLEMSTSSSSSCSHSLSTFDPTALFFGFSLLWSD